MLDTVHAVSRSNKWSAASRSALGYVGSIIAPAIGALAFIVIVWEIVARILDIEWMPRPYAVAEEAFRLLGVGGFRDALWISVVYALVGFAVSCVCGIVSGVYMARSAVVNSALDPYVNMLLLIPTILLAPVFLIVFGLGLGALMALIFIFCYPMITITTRSAVLDVPEIYYDVGKAFGARGWRIAFFFTIPAALPQIFAGLHLGIARAMKGMLAGELFLAVIGVGTYLTRFTQTFAIESIWALAVILIVISIILVWIVGLIDHVVNFWQASS